MKDEAFMKLWKETFPDLHKMKLDWIVKEALEKFDLTKAQHEYTLLIFKNSTPYPHLYEYFQELEKQLRDDAVPNDLCCQGYNSDIEECRELAGSIEVLEAAWFPNERVDQKTEVLRAALERLLE